MIPRPTNARPGSPPPWAALPAEARTGLSLHLVRAVFGGRVGPSVAWPGAGHGRPAAVLVALFEDDGEARVILTRRSAEMRSHRGEVAFPGGRLDEGENTVEGALREAAEEVDLDPALVEIVGELAPLSTMSSASAITPVVGVMAARPELRPNPMEVDRVFDVGLAELLADDVFVEELWSTPTWSERPMFFFHVADETVWGATARVLYELLILITDTDVPNSGP